jgi:hypothetical protein
MLDKDSYFYILILGAFQGVTGIISGEYDECI